MKRLILVILLNLLLLIGCSRTPVFVVEGEISHAEGKMLYFEHFGLNATDVLDSVKLNKKGEFRFKIEVPSAPEFYRLRIDKRFIHLAADSVRTVSIRADGLTFGKAYEVEGSKSCRLIRDLSLWQGQTLLKTDSIRNLYKQKSITDEVYQDELFRIFSEHREQAKVVIYEDPLSPAAYFALFQRFYNYLLFDPYDESDNKCYAAVATSWNSFFPDAQRTKHLVKLTLQGMKEIRQTRKAKDIKITETDQTTFFEINLPNLNNKKTSLSSLKGNIILLDFTAYQTEFAPTRNMYFRELYQEFANQGFVIYQVSFDPDEHFWKTSASNLPWICVRDAGGTYSDLFTTYNISQLPTFFLLNREGNIIARDAQIDDLYQEIQKLL
jgi:peroxiredoxin